MRTTRLSRRAFLTATATGAASVAFPNIITTAKGAANELVFVGFGGGYQDGQTKALFEPFEKETGIKVVQTTGVDLAKLRAQVQSKNVEWDLISIPDRLRYTAVRDGLLQKLNYGVINAKDIQANLVTEYAVGCVTIPMLLTYSTKAHPPGKEPKTWMDYWDPAKVPGIRAMFGLGGVLVEALDDVVFGVAPFDDRDAEAMPFLPVNCRVRPASRHRPRWQ